MKEKFKYGIDRLNIETALKLADNKIEGIITEKVAKHVKVSFNAVQSIARGDKLVYSINTGIGSLCRTKISKEETGKLQENLLKSHSVGVGKRVSRQISKLMLIIKLHSLCYGYSGISLEVLHRILWHIDNDIIPSVPEQGSVGASGDLAQLAHLFLPLIGLGLLSDNGKNFEPSIKVLEKHDKKPLKLHAKEGLALINGTQFICAFAIKAYEEFKKCINHSDIIAALSLEGYLGSPQPFNEELINLRPHPGAIQTAKTFRKLLENSEFVDSHKDCGRVQDPYSLRCIPQVHGASRDAFEHFQNILERELNSVTDNPVVLEDNKAISGGNFHGQPIAIPLDYLGLAASELGNISDRRTFLLLEGKWGLPTYLMEHSGINSGFMIAQYTSAALVSENKSLCFPASADSIPTSMGQEDHVSMGPISARKTLRIIENLEKILAIELICACQAFDFRRPLKSSKILDNIHEFVRKQIPHLKADTVLSEFISMALDIIRSGDLLQIANLPIK
ncbi:MAG: histidine ammonia-lyase [Candidatus Lokiarchaeota archaeon]|nr:histidine ammonia-lyase [Candidatus Lokiarchaeota archaeon]MBD3199227.1 histidine ammonia-lyase [Candidatus Lokiarchaeota archaeon]